MIIKHVLMLVLFTRRDKMKKGLSVKKTRIKGKEYIPKPTRQVTEEEIFINLLVNIIVDKIFDDYEKSNNLHQEIDRQAKQLEH